MQLASMRSKLIHWLIAIRPHTLTMTAAPVLVGSALAWNQTEKIHWLAVSIALISGLLIQAATNLYNDGADHIGGVPILILGVLSILAGWGYSGGPRPIAYTPFGELFVVVFFGLGAVGGTCWLAGGFMEAKTIMVGLSMGVFASAVLLVNNFRDIECDTKAGRRTLSIVIGEKLSKCLYVAFMLLPFILLPAIIHMAAHDALWLTYAVLPASVYQCRRFVIGPPGKAFNKILKRTGQTQLAYGILLSVGLVV